MNYGGDDAKMMYDILQTTDLFKRIILLNKYISEGRDVNTIFGKFVPTPLMLLSYDTLHTEDDNLELIKILLNNGADVNTLSDRNINAILYSIRVEHYKITKYLLNQPNIDINEQFNENKTYLHNFIDYQVPLDIIQILIDKGIDINIQDDNLRTPLFTCIEESNYTDVSNEYKKKVIKLLLDNNADITIANYEGLTPYNIASPDILGEELYSRLKPTRNIDNTLNTTTKKSFTEFIDTLEPKLSSEVIELAIKKIKVYDPIEIDYIELNKKDIEDDKDNMYFKYTNSYFRIDKEYINNSIKKYENIIFDCKKLLLGAPRITNIEDTEPYYLLRLVSNFAIKLEELKGALLSNSTMFELKKVGEKIYTASFGSVISPNHTSNYAGRRVNIVSADHCQDGSKREIFSLRIIELINKKNNINNKNNTNKNKNKNKNNKKNTRKNKNNNNNKNNK